METQEKKKKCPICGNLQGTRVFCEECGWDFTTALDEDLLKMLGEEEKREYSDRILILKKVYQGYKKSRQGIKSGIREEIILFEGEKNGCLSEMQGKEWRMFSGNLVVSEGYQIIGEHAFEKARMESLTLPKSLEKIGKMAFACCESLRKVKMPKVREIGLEAFMSCKNLESIELPEGLEKIELAAFGYCTNLKEVVLPSTLKYVGYTVFSKCSSLKTIYLRKGISQEVVKDLEHMKIHAEIIWVGEDDKCIDIGQEEKENKKIFDPELMKKSRDQKSIRIPEGYEKIKGRAFEGWINLETVWMPDSITEIGANAFYGCLNLTQIRWSKNLKIIQTGAFSGCTSLKKIRIPKQTVEIGKVAFSGCQSLESVQLPASLKKVGENVFWGCNRLTVIQTAKELDAGMKILLGKECVKIQ